MYAPLAQLALQPTSYTFNKDRESLDRLHKSGGRHATQARGARAAVVAPRKRHKGGYGERGKQQASTQACQLLCSAIY